MFKCENCGDQVGINQPMNKAVVERRSRDYENIIRPPQWNPKAPYEGPRSGPGGYNKIKTIYSSGWEIVKEIETCPKCFLSLTGKEPHVREPTAPRRANPRFVDAESTRKYGNRDKHYQPREQKERKPPVVEVVNPVKLERS